MNDTLTNLARLIDAPHEVTETGITVTTHGQQVGLHAPVTGASDQWVLGINGAPIVSLPADRANEAASALLNLVTALR